MIAMTHESVERRPISLAKIRKCFLRRFVRLSFASAHHQRPMRRVERRTSFLQRSGYRLHGIEHAPFIDRGLSLSNATEVLNSPLTSEKNCGTGISAIARC